MKEKTIHILKYKFKIKYKKQIKLQNNNQIYYNYLNNNFYKLYSSLKIKQEITF